MSALTDALDPRPRQCAAAKAREALGVSDPDSAADFDAWMVGRKVEKDGELVKLSDTDMWVALQALEFRVAQQTLGRHRRGRGECVCTS